MHQHNTTPHTHIVSRRARVVPPSPPRPPNRGWWTEARIAHPSPILPARAHTPIALTPALSPCVPRRRRRGRRWRWPREVRSRPSLSSNFDARALSLSMRARVRAPSPSRRGDCPLACGFRKNSLALGARADAVGTAQHAHATKEVLTRANDHFAQLHFPATHRARHLPHPRTLHASRTLPSLEPREESAPQQQPRRKPRASCLRSRAIKKFLRARIHSLAAPRRECRRRPSSSWPPLWRPPRPATRRRSSASPSPSPSCAC
jgi:hypothetical protein